MCKPHSTLLTKQQLQNFFDAHGCKEALPTRKTSVYLTWPIRGYEVDVAECKWTEKKGAYGDRLYEVIQSSQAGRNFVATVQDAHVHAYRARRLEQDRQARLQRHLLLTET